MYSFSDKRYIKKIRLVTYLIPSAILLALILLLMLGVVKLESGTLATIGVALIGWPVAVDNIFLQINNSLKRKLETDAIQQLDETLIGVADAFVGVVTFDNDFVAKPMKIPDDLWYKAASDRHMKIANESVKMREAFGRFYRALEGNEIVIIHLEQYYRYMTLIMGDFIEHIDDLNTQFLKETSKWNLTEKEYKRAVTKFSILKDEWSHLAACSMDFRKMTQNELLGDVFKRELDPRKPLPGYGPTLKEIATKQHVQEMIDERNEKIGLPKGLA